MNALAKNDSQAVANIADPTTLLAVISRAASDPTVDIDKMDRLLAMHERMVGQQAAQRFNEAMNRAQSRMGRIATDANNPQTRSKYASYAALDRHVRPIYTDEGFALSFNTGDGAPADHVRLVCDVSHAAGHTKSYHVDMPADGKGAKGGDVMTKTHAAGAAMTYGQRYLLKLIFNIAIGEADNDGNAPLSNEQQKAAAAIDAWAETINGADSPENVNKIKAELVNHYGSKDKVPARLKTACVTRLAELAK